MILDIPNCEDLWIEVKINQGGIIFAVIYRHPNFKFQSFEKSLSHNLLELEDIKLQYVVSGDMNINKLIH